MVEENYQHICNHPAVSGDLVGMVEHLLGLNVPNFIQLEPSHAYPKCIKLL